MCFMPLRQLKLPKSVKIYNFEKCLYSFTNRLHNNANEKIGYATEKLNARKRGHVFRMKLAQNIRKTKNRVEEIIERENIWTIPNFLCVGRIITTPCLTYLIICSQDYQVFDGKTENLYNIHEFISIINKINIFLGGIVDFWVCRINRSS